MRIQEEKRRARGIEQHRVLEIANCLDPEEEEDLSTRSIEYQILSLVSDVRNQLQNFQQCSKFNSALIIDKGAQPGISNIICL